jgi:hypothetical protein
MPDTYTNYIGSPTSVPPLTRAVIAAMPVTQFGNTVGPALTDKSFRSLLDALAGLEQRLITAGF